MDSFEPPLVITAISDPEFEGLVSSALFTQGWSVVARALDFSELQRALKKDFGNKLLVIFSTDLPGASQREINEVVSENTLLFGFSDESGSDRGFSNISPRPKTPEELLLAILENVRSTSRRTPLIHMPVNLSAQVIAIGGVRHSVGTTTFALNLAQEFSLTGSRTLLIDANFQAPAIAALLDQRHLAGDSKWREFAPLLSVMELTQESLGNFDSAVSEAGESFEKIVIDLGSLTHLAKELSDRRWSSKMKIWASRNADDFCAVTNFELLNLKAFDDFINSTGKLSLTAKLHTIKIRSALKQIQRSQPSRQSEPGESKIAKSWSLPWDQRSCQLAVAERSTLVQVAERSSLRKEIAAMAYEIGGKPRK